MICPICGGMVAISRNSQVLRDFSLHHEETSSMEGCLCFYSLDELGAMLEQFERSLTVMLSEQFGEKSSMDEIRAEIRNLPKHIPLRDEMTRRLRILDRLRERVKQGRKLFVSEDEQKEKVAAIKNEAIRGGSLTFRDWTKSFGQ